MRLFLKTFQSFQHSIMGLPLSIYLGRLPKWGSMLNGEIYSLKMLARATRVKDGSLWPTPKAMEVNETVEQWETRRRKPGKKMMGKSLTVAVKYWNTPTRSDYKSSALSPAAAKRDSLPGDLLRMGERGYLNPNWEELLMGFPVGWTSLDFPPDLVSSSTPMSRRAQHLVRQRRTHGLRRSVTPSYLKLRTRYSRR